MKYFQYSILLLCWLLNSSSQAQKFIVTPINFLTESDIFSPVFFNNDLVVCCNKKDRIFSTIIDNSNKEPVSLFVLNPKDTSSLEPFSTNLRSKFNDGPISFNAEFNKAVFSKNNTDYKKKFASDKDEYNLGIYFSNLIGEDWSEPTPFPYNSAQFTNSHPTISEDGKLLVFTSNREGGFGGYDLWYSIFTTSWSEPKNCGPYINSSANEFFPVLNNELLFFSSTKENGMGMMDIYYTYLNSQKEPTHLPAPINSPEDDFGLITTDEINTGYFSSNRNDLDKIFSFEYDFPSFENCEEQIYDDFCYTLYEENALSLDVQSLIYFWKINDEKIRGVSIDYCFIEEGVYEISLDIQDTVLNETYYNQANYEVLIEYTQQAFITAPDTVGMNAVFVVSAEHTYLPHTEIVEYYWEHGNGRKTVGKTAEIQFNKEGNYTIQLGIIGKESDSIVKYCSLKTVHCGDGTNTDDVFPNLIPALIDDTSLVKESNYFYANDTNSTNIKYSVEIAISDTSSVKRNELIYRYLLGDTTNKITIQNNPDTDLFFYRIGEWDSLTGPYNTWVELQKLGLKDAVVRSYKLEDTKDLIELGKFFVMEHVQFDSDSYALKEDVKVRLDELIKVLKNVPAFSLDLIGHTDNTGSDGHNLELSKNRTLEIKKYFVENGLKGERISPSYFGESKPIATNDTEEGKYKNRRVEFKFVMSNNEK